MFQSPKSASTSELETSELLVDVHVHLLATNGLSMNKGAPLYSLVDFQLSLYKEDSDDILDSARDDVSIVSVSSSSHSFRSQSSVSTMSKTHRSSYSTWEFVYSLSAVVVEDDLMQLKQAKVFSLLLDESNDVSVTKNLMIFYQAHKSVCCVLDKKFDRFQKLYDIHWSTGC